MSDHDHNHEPIDQRLHDAAMAGCEESRAQMTRRAFMGVSASLFTCGVMPGVAGAATVAGRATPAPAVTPTENGPRLLIVQLRGGVDGLNVLIPHGDPNYGSLRGRLALDTSTALELPRTSDFRLNRNLPDFHSWYRTGQAAIVRAVAPPLHNRSHFDCQDNIDTGLGGQTRESCPEGWLGRYLKTTVNGNPVVPSGAVAINRMPLILRGAPLVHSWATALNTAPQGFFDSLTRIYGSEASDLSTLIVNGRSIDQMALTGTSAVIKQQLLVGSNTVVNSFYGAGKLLGANGGPRIGVLSIDNWDYHSDQTGALVSNLSLLNQCLVTFKNSVGSRWSQTVVVCVSEFGRSVVPNGHNGTDHGVGTVALLAGGAVAGGQMFGRWPGLRTLEEYGGILPLNDLRSVFKGILKDHLRASNAQVELAFPNSGSAPTMQGLIADPTRVASAS
jgi:uncharacterized protein (DUF1501 family)